MSADIVNLRQFKKRRQRDDDSRKAEENRRIHGRSKSERSLEEAERSMFEKKLDQGRIERKPGDDAD
ncbi:DUF4169 family protein [Martelella sp. HB161492]|uniref:DUF4169 family protein n=1 Tax=Martelella sp. HB161492 TaxID=2720726 RepID=UPI001590BFD6|nr:DUF4169 family protein [Martelella sp. HB161492]